jgi:hypothetical protein
MADGFKIHSQRAAGAAPTEEKQMKASTAFNPGDMLVDTKGYLEKASATSKGMYVFVSMITPKNLPQPAAKNTSTTAGEMAIVEPVGGAGVVLRSKLTGNSAPPLDGKACNSNTTATEIVITEAGSNDDYGTTSAPGTVYCPELDEQRLIIGDAQSGGAKTLTVDRAFSRALTTGDTIRAIPWAIGATAVKFSSTNPHEGLGTAIADKSSGHNRIVGVDLANYLAFSTCPDLE